MTRISWPQASAAIGTRRRTDLITSEYDARWDFFHPTLAAAHQRAVRRARLARKSGDREDLPAVRLRLRHTDEAPGRRSARGLLAHDRAHLIACGERAHRAVG